MLLWLGYSFASLVFHQQGSGHTHLSWDVSTHQCMHKISIAVLIIFLGSCNTQSKTSQEENSEQVETGNSNTSFRFDQNDDFQILDFEHLNEHEPTDSIHSICQEWQLSKTDIHQILTTLTPINGYQWHYEFGQYPCYFNGAFSQNGGNFKFSINSGSWLTITSDTTIYFGDTEGKLTELFLDDRWTDEDYQ